MNEYYRHSALFTVLSLVVSAFAGVGIWSLFNGSMPVPPWLLIPIGTCAAGLISVQMLRATAHEGYEAGVNAAATDSATRLPSQTIARQLLMREFAAAERGRNLAVALFSVDNLPRLMVTRPDEASRILLHMGAILKRRTRGMNVSARLGEGHTFITVLGGVDEFGARKFADKVMKDIAGLSVGGNSVSVRTGICGYDAGMLSVDDLLAKAQGALIEPAITTEALRIA